VRIVLQRVARAEVRVDNRRVAAINAGLLLLVAVGREDTVADLSFWARKVAHVRVFRDERGKMNRSVLDVEGEVLCVPQFTLYGACHKGLRPSFDGAASPADARALFARFVALLGEQGASVQAGQFGAMMEVELVNDGPVTLILERHAAQ